MPFSFRVRDEIMWLDENLNTERGLINRLTNAVNQMKGHVYNNIIYEELKELKRKLNNNHNSYKENIHNQ